MTARTPRPRRAASRGPRTTRLSTFAPIPAPGLADTGPADRTVRYGSLIRACQTPGTRRPADLFRGHQPRPATGPDKTVSEPQPACPAPPPGKGPTAWRVPATHLPVRPFTTKDQITGGDRARLAGSPAMSAPAACLLHAPEHKLADAPDDTGSHMRPPAAIIFRGTFHGLSSLSAGPMLCWFSVDLRSQTLPLTTGALLFTQVKALISGLKTEVEKAGHKTERALFRRSVLDREPLPDGPQPFASGWAC